MTSAKSFEPKDIRNVAIVGHGHSGKTALAEAILFDDGATTRLGHTEDGTSIFDSEPEEVHRGGSIFSHFGWVEHAGRKINLIDTPGDQNFFLNGLNSLLGTDSVIAVISAQSGAGLQAKRAWAVAVERGLARIIFLNKMDRATQPWKDLVKRIGQSLHVEPLVLQVPIGTGDQFEGVIDLLSRKAYRWKRDGQGKALREDVPGEWMDEVMAAEEEMMEAIVSTDDLLLEEYLDKKPISPEKIRTAFLNGVRQRRLVPILFGAAKHNMGIQPLLDVVAESFPNPMERETLMSLDTEGNSEEAFHDPEHPFLAQVIQTTMDEHVGQISVIRIFSGELPTDGHIRNANTGEELRLGAAYVLRGRERMKVDRVTCGDIISAVKLKNTHTSNTLCAPTQIRFLSGMTYPKPMISYVLQPETKSDDDKLKFAIDRLMEEDPTLSYSIDDVSHRMVLHGMGHGHLESAIERMRRKLQVHVKTDLPPIPYREAFTTTVRSMEGKHKKQSGGAGQFGVCVVDVEPLSRDSGIEFVNDIYGGSIPRQFIPSVEKGVRECAKHGIIAGYPVTDFRVILKDGKHHPVDSKDIAFQMAGWKALKNAMNEAGLLLLEPHYKMEIVVPVENAGDIMGDITSRRGHVDGMDTYDQNVAIRATCPLSEVQEYLPDLRSMTGGKGSFVMEFDSYKEVPGNLVEKIREASPFQKMNSDREEE